MTAWKPETDPHTGMFMHINLRQKTDLAKHLRESHTYDDGPCDICKNFRVDPFKAAKDGEFLTVADSD